MAGTREDAFLHYQSLLSSDVSRFAPDVIHPYFLGSPRRIDSHAAAIVLFLKELGRLTGKSVLPVKVGVDRSEAFSQFGNIIFVLDEEDSTSKLLDKYHDIISLDQSQEKLFDQMKASAEVAASECFSSKFYKSDQDVASFNLFVKTGQSEFDETGCAFREILRHFGLHSHQPHGRPSIFRDGAAFEMFSPMDIAAVIFHYRNAAAAKTPESWAAFWSKNSALEAIVYGDKR